MLTIMSIMEIYYSSEINSPSSFYLREKFQKLQLKPLSMCFLYKKINNFSRAIVVSIINLKIYENSSKALYVKYVEPQQIWL